MENISNSLRLFLFQPLFSEFFEFSNSRIPYYNTHDNIPPKKYRKNTSFSLSTLGNSLPGRKSMSFR